MAIMMKPVPCLPVKSFLIAEKPILSCFFAGLPVKSGALAVVETTQGHP
jgi:hypothetical protein